MTPYGWALCSFARSRGAVRLAVVLPLCLGLCLLVPRDLSPVPFQLAVSTRFWVLAAALAPASVPVLMTSPFGPLELTGTARPAILHLGWSTLLLITLAAPGLLAFGISGDTGVVLVRNALLMVGLGLLAAVLLPSVVAWMVPLAVLMLCFLYGTVDQAGTPHAWAVLLLDASVAPAWWGAVALALAGTIAYAARDSRP